MPNSNQDTVTSKLETSTLKSNSPEPPQVLDLDTAPINDLKAAAFDLQLTIEQSKLKLQRVCKAISGRGGTVNP